jgi:hypothetical protein
MVEIRRIGLLVLSVAAIAIFLLMEPDRPEQGSSSLSATSYQSLIDLAMSDYDANDALAESAPQQQVVNGWVARDLLQIQARQLTGQIVATTDSRVPALLVVAILAIGLIGFTTEFDRSGDAVRPDIATDDAV